MNKFIDLTGQIFERLTVIKRTDNDKYGNAMWLCECNCKSHNQTIVSGSNLRQGTTKSCGCIALKTRTRHGYSRTKAYNTWWCIKERCYNKNSEEYHNYGGRGITFSDEFLNDIVAFCDYVSALKNYNKSNYSIDRIDNNGIYERGNLKWSSQSAQNFNRRISPKNKTGVTGVYYRKNRPSPWKASISINHKTINLGCFKTKEEAIEARKQAELKYIIGQQYPANSI